MSFEQRSLMSTLTDIGRHRSRLKALEADTPSEEQPSEDVVPSEPWPFRGAVELDGVTVSYTKFVYRMLHKRMRLTLFSADPRPLR